MRSSGYTTLFQTCSRPYHRLCERSGQREEKGHQPPAPVYGGVHHVPRMHCVGGDTVRRKAPVELVAEEDVAEFGAVVGQHGPIVLLRGRQQLHVHLAARV